MRDAILNWAADITWKRPWTIVVLAILLALVSGVYAARELRLNADTDDLISPSRPFMKEYRRFLKEFGDLEYIYVAVVDGGDTARTRAAVDSLTAKLKTIPGLPGVYSGVTVNEQLRIATRSMPDEELEGLAQAARGLAPFLERHTASGVVRHANQLLQRLIREGRGLPREEQEQLGAAAVFALKAIASVQDQSPSALEMEFFLGENRSHEYFASPTSNGGSFYFISVIPIKDYGTLAIIEEPLRRIRAAMDEVRSEFPGIEMGLTGKAVLQADEMATTARDMMRASILAFIIVAGLFMIFLRGVLKPALAAIAFIVAGACTYGFAAVAIGYLNLLSIVFVLVLVGIGFDYGVHIIARYNEHRATMNVRESIRQALLHTGRANITSAITSSAVFLLALVTQFRGLQELGLIAGVGLLLCLLSMMLVLPALLTIVERGKTGAAASAKPQAAAGELRAGLLRPVLARPGAILIVVIVGTTALLFAEGRVGFESNLLRLQAEGLESVQWERRILDESPSMTWFGAVVAESQQDVLDVILRAADFGTIGLVRSALMPDQTPSWMQVEGIVRPDSPKRDRLRAALHQRAAADGGAPAVAAGDSTILSPDDLAEAARILGIMAAASAAQEPQEAARLRQLADDLHTIREQIQLASDHGELVRQNIEHNISAIGNSLRAMLQADLLDLRAALPDALRDQSISPTGRYLVMLHPRRNVWEYEAMSEFVSDLRAIDPNVTGAPIATYESVRDMRNAFITMAILAFVVVSFLVWLDFRSVRFTILAMGPLVIGLLWLTEIMGLTGISFNLANFFSVSILLGVTVDGAVHILHRYREGGPARLHLGATRRAVILTSLTTMIGFGCLILASHRGLFSLGLVMAIGSASCLLACLIVLPAFLAWRERKRPNV